MLKACNINVNSLAGKCGFMKNLILAESIDVVAVTETWLTESCNSSFVMIDGYSIFRGDVHGNIRKHGAALYVRKSLRPVEVEVNLPNLAVVYLSFFDLYIVAIYRPPSYSLLENQSLIGFISEFVRNREVLFLGDFNLPTLDWISESVFNSYIRPLDKLFFDCFVDSGLSQWVRFGTFFPSGNTLDLILTTDDDRIGEVFSVPPFPGCHHCPVLCTVVFNFGNQMGVDVVEERKSWARANFEQISSDLLDVNWEQTFETLSLQQAYSFLIDVINDSVDRNVPTRAPLPKGKWMTAPPRALANERKSCWREYITARRTYGRESLEAQLNLSNYNRLNHQYRNYARYRQCIYEKKLADLIPEAPKLFHAYLRERKKGCPSVGPLKDEDGILVQEGYGMSELFADSFSSVYVEADPVEPHPSQVSEAHMEDLLVSYDMVLNVLLSLSPTSSSGADGIHPSILRHCAGIIALPLTLIIRRSLETGDVPTEWKQSRVVPIFKSGPKSIPLNYRPVSITSAPCKVTERLLADHIIGYLEQNNLLCDRQFGFRKGRSTDDQLLLTYGKIAREVDDGKVVDAVYLDYSKAFDVLSHNLLLSKLESIGFCPQICDWIRAFLIGRCMQVSVDGSHSDPRAVLSGVPQGSVLGPLLFIIYVNSLGLDFNCEWYAFADDLKLFTSRPRSSANEADEVIQQDLHRLYDVSSSWNLRLNLDKCVVMRFGSRSNGMSNNGINSGYLLGGSPLKLVYTHKDLGVLVDADLRFHAHIASIVGKATGLLHQLLRGTVCRSMQFMNTLLVSHIRSLLEYCSTVWNVGYLGDARRLESIQRRWTREVEGLSGLEYVDRLKTLDLFSIRGRLLRSDLIKLWKIFNPQSEVGLATLFEREFHLATRGHRYKLSVPRCRTETMRRFFSVRVVREWNALPLHVVEAGTVNTFKARLDKHMGDKFFEVP